MVKGGWRFGAFRSAGTALRRIGAGLALLGLVTLIAAQPAVAASGLGGGGTVATVDGTSVTITVHIDLCCVPEDAATRDAFVPLVQAEIKAAQDMWNRALANLPAKGCFDVKVVFVARLLNKGQAWDPDYHRITLNFSPGRPYSEDFWATSKNADDGTVYTQIVYGQFYEPSMSVGTWAHEIGHLMGLGDDYYEEHGLGHQAMDCLPGRDDTLMCKSRTGKIDQALADRLADILNSDGLLPQCWAGTMRSVTNANIGGVLTCTGETWDHQIKLIVDGQKHVKGKATSRLAAAPHCVGLQYTVQDQLSHIAKNSTWDITGNLSDKQFELNFFETYIDGGTPALINSTLNHWVGAPTIVVPLTTAAKATGTSAAFRANIPYSPGTTATASHMVDLNCTTCRLVESGSGVHP
jgi:hypothetical protein